LVCCGLGVAFRTLPVGEQSEDAIEQELVWLGVVGMIDPPRPEAIASVKQAQQAGIRVIMITGDHPATAVAIAAELGIIKPDGRAIAGAELRHMSDKRLTEVVRDAAVYARVAPEQKLRIVRALKANGEIVAMTGDGVNDAPALKAADIGVAMGITGTDVSKGAADMILVDDNFASIVAAVEEGRSIFRNIQEFLRFLLSSNLGEVMTMFFGVLLAGVIGLTPEAGSAERSAFLDLFTNKWIWLAVLVSVVLHLCVVYIPFLQVPFETVALSATDWLVCIGIASFVLWFYELLKLVRH
jgi:P-type Ca2+ transporter type 2C